ncbi:MAG TPA: stage III sporulation protein AB [Candidatus Eisenbergiella stercoravium]|nr:stage III sporulation protein AB [Candidatus Eisenbergiella stercoravium]
MLRFVGACLLIAGSSGFGWCIWRDLERRAEQLKLLERAFVMLESEVGYSRLTLPDGLLRVGSRLEGTLGNCLRRIGTQVRAEPGITLKEAWEELMPEYLKQTVLGGREKALVMTFPEYTGFVDGRMQLAALEQFAGEMSQAKEAAQHAAENGKKTILSISAAAGLLLAILLF